MPGALPVLNETAIRLAIKTGLALNCEIAGYTKWDRKNYFYPDLPKGYQTSQFDLPICSGGYLDVSDPKATFEPGRIRLERAHLEEDAGKSMHDESGQGRASKIDLNRAGVPLLEIVTKPDLRSAAQAKGFLQELRLILTYIEVSDCNMQEGSLRCDANVNLRIPRGDSTVATPITEVKNLNSFRAVERAIQAEARRQFEVWQTTGLTIDEAPKQTRGWNDSANATFLQREKEESADYRYFPCPDLIAYRTDDATLESISLTIERLPFELRNELVTDYGLKPYDADVLVSQGRGVVAYYFKLTKTLLEHSPIATDTQLETAASKLGVGRLAANWVGQEVLRCLNERSIAIEQYPVSARQLGELLQKIRNEELDQTRAKDVLNIMLENSISINEAIERLGIVGVGAEEIVKIAERLIAENPGVVQQFRDGNAKAIGALIGKAKQLNPNANPGLVKAALVRLVGGV
jgi:aspartyl-tRNA(Asn)/glutamyl-tRNA(Gln) amidotransferase subunit B